MDRENSVFSDEILPKSKEWKQLYKKASSKDKKTMDSIIKSMNESVGSKDKPFLQISKKDYATLNSKGKFTATKMGTKFSHRPSPSMYKQYPEGLKFVTIKNPNTNEIETIKVKDVDHTDSAIYIELVKESVNEGINLKSLEPINGSYGFNQLSKMSDMGSVTKITKKIFDNLVEKLKKAGADVLTGDDDKLYTVFSYGDNYNLVKLKENINEATYTNQTGVKSAVLKEPEFYHLHKPKAISWIRGKDVKILFYGRFMIFTDGKRELVTTNSKPFRVVKALGRASKETINQFNNLGESVINEANEYDVFQKLFKKAGGNEIKFYDEIQALHDKMGHPKYMKFVSMALKSHGVDMFRDPKIKNPAEAEEYLYNLLKNK